MKRLRTCIQTLALMLLVYAVWEFYQYFQYNNHPRPPLIEALLPVSALPAARIFFSGMGFDSVHPAGLTIFFAAIVIAFVARKGFCGYLCPVGWLLGLLNILCARIDKKLGSPLGLPRRPGKLISTLISLPKYILLAGLLWVIFVRLSPEGLQALLSSPYNQTLDTRIWLFFTQPSRDTLITLGIIFAGSIITPGFWCRGFCPYGALLGLFSFFSPFAVRRDKTSCTYCRRCAKACQMRVAVHEATRINSPECQGCLECVAACPVDGCLKVQVGRATKGGAVRTVPVWLIPLLCVAIMAGAYFIALHSGYWHSAE